MTDYPAENERSSPSEADVDAEASQGAAGLDSGDMDPSGAPDPAADRDREAIGRIAGQDEGYAAEQGADRRAGGNIGGAAGGRQ